MNRIKVNLMVGRFQPFTYGHLKCVDFAWQLKELPTVIAMINTPDNKVDEKHPFPSSMLLPMYENVFKTNSRVETIILVRNANIVEIGEDLYNSGYEIASWTCGTDRLASYLKMAEKYAELAHLTNDFTMLEVPRSDEDISATKVRKALLADDETTFNKLTPLNDLKSRLKGEKNYDILKELIKKVMNK